MMHTSVPKSKALLWKGCTAAAVLGLALVALSGASASGFTGALPLLRVGVPESLSTLDHAKNNGLTISLVDGLGLEPLVLSGPDGRPQPYLATSITQPGKDVYVFQLRHGVRFWDGSPLTATDVANAINYFRYPSFQSAPGYRSVKNVTARGPYTVVVTLKYPDSTFLYNGAQTGIFEKKFGDAHKGTMGNPGVLMMGSGPWQPVSFDPTRGIDLQANPHWWHGSVPIKRITFSFFSDENSEALAFRAGELDVTFPADPRAFRATSGARIVSTPSTGVGLLSMNTHVAPWSDLHVRRAVAYAINRAAIVNALGPFNYPMTTLIPAPLLASLAPAAQVKTLLASLPSYAYSLARAKQELAKSAYPHGFSTNIVSTDYYGMTTVAQAVAGELQAIGIHLTVQSLTFPDWVNQLIGPLDRRPSLIAVGVGASDPSTWLAGFGSSKNAIPGAFNTAVYTNSSFDSALQVATSSTNAAQRFAAYGQMLKLMATDVPYVPIWSPANAVALSDKISWPGTRAVNSSLLDWTKIRAS
jgi:peptide/nickel transport system substrate-binding protein